MCGCAEGAGPAGASHRKSGGGEVLVWKVVGAVMVLEKMGGVRGVTTLGEGGGRAKRCVTGDAKDVGRGG